MKSIYFVLTAMLTFSLNSYAGMCTKVDFSAEFGPVRDQQDKGWCYANAAADLIGHRLREELDFQQISAAHIALVNNSLVRPDPLSESGTMRISARAALIHGMCMQSVENEALRRGPRGSLNDKLLTLRKIKRLHDTKQFGRLNRRLDELAAQNSILKDLPRPELMKILSESSRRNFPLRLADRLCEGHKKQSPRWLNLDSHLRVPGGKAGPDLMGIIDRELDQRNPVGIGYFSNFLTSKTARKKDGHASVLVGREWNNATGKCEYKIRNSWGAGCGYYVPELRTKCYEDPGHIWVDRETLDSNLVSITYIAD